VGCLFRMLAGVLLVAIGVGIGWFVPPYVEKAAEDEIKIPDLTVRTWGESSPGASLLVYGTINRHNKKLEHDMVLGQRSKWVQTDRRLTNGRKEWAWRSEQEFRQDLRLNAPGFGGVVLKPDSVLVTGDAFVKEQAQKFRWEGLKVGQMITVETTLTSKEPHVTTQKPQTSIFVGDPATWRKNKTTVGAKAMTWIFYVMGGIFALGGVATFFTAPFKRKG
jgi:hypothetical protein